MESTPPRRRIDLSHLGRIAQHLPDTTDLTLITLKGHLLVEELLDAIIASHCKDQSVLEGVEIGFFVKVKLAAALTGEQGPPFAWTMAERLNTLRNSLAHKLEHPLAQKRLENFLCLLRNEEQDICSSGDQVKDLRHATIYLMGLLMAIKNGPSAFTGLGIDA
jgi:hypothetical protein